ncbi:patatin-like phospholipase family protein, partial [Zunongwangia profunda]
MPVKFKPFDKIGLCFSGGGYRATFYGLGVLSVLHKIQFQEKSLLEAVKSISSVSGGTLLAAAYTRSVQKNQHFNDFYQKLYTTFEPANDQLLENATRKLKDDQVWKNNAYNRRSVINAFALCYQEMEVFEGT